MICRSLLILLILTGAGVVSPYLTRLEDRVSYRFEVLYVPFATHHEESRGEHVHQDGAPRPGTSELAIDSPEMTPHAVTILISAFLLLQVQPLIGKYILPWFGSSPGVWITSVLAKPLLMITST